MVIEVKKLLLNILSYYAFGYLIRSVAMLFNATSISIKIN